MAEKKASVHWQGGGKTGTGNISTDTGLLKDSPYGFASRFGDDRKGTNPEEILGAAHAACFTVARASRSTESRRRCKRLCPLSIALGAVPEITLQVTLA